VQTIQTPHLLRDWIAYAVQGFVSAELRELDKRAKKAAEDRERFDQWAAEFWADGQRQYAERMLAPILAACKSQVGSNALAAEICSAAVDELRAGDPVAVLDRWRKDRADELTDSLYEDLKHGQA